ncbi:hypothetical protein GCM10009674_02100 [Nesterenkonia xinjiangensis]
MGIRGVVSVVGIDDLAQGREDHVLSELLDRVSAFRVGGVGGAGL